MRAKRPFIPPFLLFSLIAGFAAPALAGPTAPRALEPPPAEAAAATPDPAIGGVEAHEAPIVSGRSAAGPRRKSKLHYVRAKPQVSPGPQASASIEAAGVPAAR